MIYVEHEVRFRHGRRGGGGGGRPEEAPADDVAGWLAGRLPDGWAAAPPEVTVDRDEVLVVVPLSQPEVAGDDAARAAAEAGRVKRFREETREARMAIAREARHRYGRTVSRS